MVAPEPEGRSHEERQRRSPVEITVRPATRGDVAAVAAVEQRVFPDAWSPLYLMGVVDGGFPTLALDVAEVDGAVAGHLITSVVFEVAEVQRIAVDPRLQRRGVAKALLHDFADFARENDVERVLLEVREANVEAINLYLAQGYTEIDRRPHYYSDGEDAVVMEMTL